MSREGFRLRVKHNNKVRFYDWIWAPSLPNFPRATRALCNIVHNNCIHTHTPTEKCVKYIVFKTLNKSTVTLTDNVIVEFKSVLFGTLYPVLFVYKSRNNSVCTIQIIYDYMRCDFIYEWKAWHMVRIRCCKKNRILQKFRTLIICWADASTFLNTNQKITIQIWRDRNGEHVLFYGSTWSLNMMSNS